jgi:hypothetical protein
LLHLWQIGVGARGVWRPSFQALTKTHNLCWTAALVHLRWRLISGIEKPSRALLVFRIQGAQSGVGPPRPAPRHHGQLHDTYTFLVYASSTHARTRHGAPVARAYALAAPDRFGTGLNCPDLGTSVLGVPDRWAICGRARAAARRSPLGPNIGCGREVVSREGSCAQLCGSSKIVGRPKCPKSRAASWAAQSEPARS